MTADPEHPETDHELLSTGHQLMATEELHREFRQIEEMMHQIARHLESINRTLDALNLPDLIFRMERLERAVFGYAGLPRRSRCLPDKQSHREKTFTPLPLPVAHG